MKISKREAGILLPISALPSKYGIGCFSEEAYRFVDMLSLSGQRVWQILPLCPTSFGDSPYQSPCSFAGNPYFISLDALCGEGLITADELPSGEYGERIDYGRIYEERYPLLKKAYGRFAQRGAPSEYGSFLAENCSWLEDYALFMAIKESMRGTAFSAFPEALRKRDPQALRDARGALEYEIGFYKFLQYEFFRQWNQLRRYAHSKNVKILGDMPIYVSADSSDVWAHPELFELDGDGRPLYVAGCPPDGFSPKGQLWGNPVYRWEEHKREDFRWWVERIDRAFLMYDIVRIDHFRGFDAYYSIPYGAEDATGGFWRKACGEELFATVREQLGERPIIAEDLGFITDGVRRLLSVCGYSGMKILQFGFDGDEEHLPYNYPRGSVVYTGTHDNPTLCQWLSSLGEWERQRVAEYLRDRSEDIGEIVKHLICVALQSCSELCIIPMQDYLLLGREGRMNIPSRGDGNWSWRMRSAAMSSSVFEEIGAFARMSGRV